MSIAREGRCRQGLTFLEVLLVLALLVILAAIVWPAAERPFATRRLQLAADALRTEWIRARNQAISTGQTVRFQYVLGGREYAIEQGGELESWLSEGSPSGAEAAIALGDASPGMSLPEGITFLSVEIGDDGEDSWALDGSEPTDGGQALLDEPLLFYPDGSTSTARVVLKNEYGRCVQVSLRGLTGVATVGEVFSETELGP